ncbi:SDR family oxidoreductase [Tepidibacillus sp. HK-1]|uniref:SDR family oxidoreductase n=1 Tax=Tepidibacillus sp. HK-1 TaxID=1883407 RepID=UPI000852A2DC|nr:SDR family oxidoreductase [Tepidibacillus sp. HK-1]GBF10298.1 3-oxoacyl-[acyl-carrier-protein] reductase FabG [Tepidibacillus sp. HK-1]
MAAKGVALIIGGSQGLGKATALALAKSGYDLVINYLTDHKAAEQVVSEVNHLGRKVFAFQGDATNYQKMQELFIEVNSEFGRLDVLVHAAGPFIRERKNFYQMSIDEIQQMVHGNLLSAMYTTSLALPLMRKQKFGRIIFFGFHRANEAPSWPDRSVYAAAKVGLVSFCKTLAVEEAPYGITVNMICPSDIIGENKEKMIRDVALLKDKESLRGRPGSGEDVSRVIEFLCQKDSDFVTGNAISVSGGLDIIYPVSKQNPKKID